MSAEELARFIHEEWRSYDTGCRPKLPRATWEQLSDYSKDGYRHVAAQVLERLNVADVPTVITIPPKPEVR